MTRDETKELLMMIQAAYPNYKPQDKTVAINTWAIMLEEFDYKLVMLAFKAYVRSNDSGFSPDPGQIISKIELIRTPAELNEQEAWSLVANALRNSCYNSVEEFSKLPPLVQRAVGQPSQLRYWAMDSEFNEEVAKASFQRTYRAEVSIRNQVSKTSADVRRMIADANRNSYKAQIETKNKQTVKLSTPLIGSDFGAKFEPTSHTTHDKLIELYENLKK